MQFSPLINSFWAPPGPRLFEVVERPQLRLPRPAVTHFQLLLPLEKAEEEGMPGRVKIILLIEIVEL